MAGILISPRVEQKILGKRAAWKLKNGSPKFKDVLRQRCRLRIKERRSLLLAQARGLENLQDIEKSLHDILREEYNRFTQEIESDFVEEQWDDAEMDLVMGNYTEEDEWMNQFNYLFNDEYLEKLLDEEDQVICPLCLQGALKETPETSLRCDKCSSYVSACSKLSEVQERISHTLNVHSSSGCSSNINFLLNPHEETPYLYALCSDCSYFDIVG